MSLKIARVDLLGIAMPCRAVTRQHAPNGDRVPVPHSGKHGG